jgi:hypothetical protein
MKDTIYLILTILFLLAIPVIISVATTVGGTIIGFVLGVLVPGAVLVGAVRATGTETGGSRDQ